MIAQIPLSFPVSESYASDDFVTLPCNADAMSWVKRFPDWPYPVLIVYGQAGCGKTHLLSMWTDKTSGQYLAIDDAHQYFGDPQAENDLFHQFNLAKENGDFLMLSMDKNIAQQSILLPDLKSRLGAAPQIEITAPNDEDIAIILQKLFADRQLKVEGDVIAYIIPRIERSFSAVQKLVEKIDHHSMAEKRAVTIPLVRALIAEPVLL